MARNIGRLGTGIAWVALSLTVGAADPAEPSERVEFRINAPTMMAALIQFTQQTGPQLVFPTDGATRIAAPRVEGNMTPHAALDRLLRGSGLTYQFVNARTVSVSAKPAATSSPPSTSARE